MLCLKCYPKGSSSHRWRRRNSLRLWIAERFPRGLRFVPLLRYRQAPIGRLGSSRQADFLGQSSRFQ